MIELCLDDASLKVIVARRFGDHVDQEKRKLLFQKNVVLVYPSRDAVSIKEALECIKQRKDSQVELPNNNDNSDHTETDQDENVLTLIFLTQLGNTQKKWNLQTFNTNYIQKA